jgi:hypothetical protein
MAITPDTKDWTWVIDRPCEQCGFDAKDYPPASFANAIREQAAKWDEVLHRANAKERPAEDRWSDLEYGCHVRDVYRIFDARLVLMLNEDNPTFANWDQDETALAERYDIQDPLTVLTDLQDAATNLADRFASVGDTEWTRGGTRSNGSVFSVSTLGTYSLHDPIHHLWDVHAL